MRYVHRRLEAQIIGALKAFPALVLTGPRRAGKTRLLRHLFPKASYHLLEDPDVIARLRADPQGFLDAVKTPAILDEVHTRDDGGAWSSTTHAAPADAISPHSVAIELPVAAIYRRVFDSIS